MIINSIQRNRSCPVPISQRKRIQPSFKRNERTKPMEANQGMTQEQKTWVAVGLTTFIALAIGLIENLLNRKKLK